MCLVIDLSVFMTFNNMKNLTQDIEELKTAVTNSPKFELNADSLCKKKSHSITFEFFKLNQKFFLFLKFF